MKIAIITTILIVFGLTLDSCAAQQGRGNIRGRNLGETEAEAYESYFPSGDFLIKSAYDKSLCLDMSTYAPDNQNVHFL